MLEHLNTKNYIIPYNSPDTLKFKYMKIIEKDYAKYLEAINKGGNFCTYGQFGELIRIFNQHNNWSDKTVQNYVTVIIDELEKLGFIRSQFLNKNKYIFLRYSAFAIVKGDYKNCERLNIKKELKINRFISNITKMEYLLRYGNCFPVDNLDNQLIMITKKILDLINDSDNLGNYDLETIKNIIDVGNYKDVKELLDNTKEYTNKLGVIRFIWEEISKEFWKLKLQGQTIDREPFYFKLNLLESGKISLHYAPKIIIYDAGRDIRYYSTQANKFFNMFFNMSENATLNLKNEYLKSRDFGNEYYNKIGYTVKVIGTTDNKIKEKVEVLNEIYYKTDKANEYSPLISPCIFSEVDVSKYFLNVKQISKANDTFINANNKIEELINKQIKGEYFNE